MTFLETVKLTTLTLIFILFTNNIYARLQVLKFRTLFNVFYARCLNWDNYTQSLYFTGGNALYRYDYNEDKMYNTEDMKTEIRCVLAIDSSPNLYAITVERRIDILEWDGRSKNYKILSTLFELPSEGEYDKYLQFNSILSDRNGRFYGGTGINLVPGENLGCFYRWEIGWKTPMKLFCELTDPMGGAFDYPNKKFYFVDSYLKRIDVFNYDEASGAITNRKVLHNFREDGKYPGFVPNGVVLDTDGLMIVPAFYGYKIVAVDPKKEKIVRNIGMECKYPTSVAFGGPKLNILFAGTTRKYMLEPPCGEGYGITCVGSTGLILSKLKIE